MPSSEIEVAFAIADLSGYTALTEAHGNLHAASAVTRYSEIVEGTLEPGVRIVECVGDEILLATEDATLAVRAALKLREAIEKEPLFPAIRCGVHIGPIVQQGGRYFGSALNLTARVAAHARAGQILCTQRLAALATGLDKVEYRPLGLVRFKNIADPVSVCEVVVRRPDGERPVLDPVCRMQIRLDTAPARLPFRGETYYFCSLDCAKVFAERPDYHAKP